MTIASPAPGTVRFQATTVTPPPGFWQREASHFPQPLSPAFRVFLGWSNDVWRKLAIEHGMMFDGLEFEEIGGWVYQRLRPLGGKDRKAPPAPLMWLLVRTVPQLRGRVKTLTRGVRDDVAMSQIDSWLDRWKPDQIETIARLRAVDLPGMPDDALHRHREEVIAFCYESLRRHFELTTPMAFIAELAFACEELLGWDERQTVALLSGLSVASTEPARRLAALARMAAERPPARALIERHDDSTLVRLEQVDPDFAGAFNAYQREFGCRALRYEIADPTLEEVPSLTLGLIRDQLQRRYDAETQGTALRGRREAAIALARTALLTQPQAARDRFERLLARAERYYPTREDNEFYTVSAPIALLRYTVVEHGRRLQERGLISDREDVFFLEMDEIRPALRDTRDCHDSVERRKAERAWILEHEAAPSFGRDPGGPPPLGVFPAEAAHNIRMVLWAAEKVFGAEAGRAHAAMPRAEAKVISGVSASAGIYTGPVRVIMDETGFDRLAPGDVLVCPITSPVWSILFPSVGALVTDTGGILSHPAIISREYGIPAVVATGNATSRLTDGEVVTVDGGAGTVTSA